MSAGCLPVGRVGDDHLPIGAVSAEYLPATGEACLDLVLLHGWGANREIWRPLLGRLRPWANLTLLDIPGLAPGLDIDADALDGLLDAVLAACPPRAVYLGWSLGGQLAIELAHRHPQRVAALVTLASNPRFVAGDGWPGMAPTTFTAFCDSAQADPVATLRRFDSLQSEGAPAPRPLLRDLRRLRGDTAGAPLAALAWLQQLDHRAALAGLPQPRLHLLAEQDALVPAAIAQPLRELAGPDAVVEVIPGACHLLPLTEADQVAAHLRDACERWGLLQLQPSQPPALDKRDVAASFSRAAATYDSVARLQREVGERLLEILGSEPGAGRCVLDLGSGTGHFCEALQRARPGSQYLGLDLAEGMVRYARGHHDGEARWLVADAESLPLASASCDLVFSSLAIQWCPRPALLFAEIARVLRPGGRCVFATLGPGTLAELRAAWAAADHYQHVNDFLPASALAAAAQGVPGLQLRLERHDMRLAYTEVRDLLLELKTLGAHNVNRQRPAGLTPPGALRSMLAAYEAQRKNGLLPASYEVYFGVMDKT
ncbi:malonyl-ACP O-methyltransferase BioC [Mangrovimicrobium sediminis]|uniref:malonyl-ACP O-methyltransferase BioC n=1 Tax=Mangrovimicrobium sediminis TaxID=2562682 RepID=UPI00143699D3|nr:malonyl-ACP O-methyltransferase BioC [Haliea sp. SAOS-164]